MRIKSGNVERIVSDEVGKNLIAAKKAEEIKESTDIKGLKLNELKALAAEKGIESFDSMKKEELIEALKDVV